MRRVRRKSNRGDLVLGQRANFNRRGFKTKMKLGDNLVQCDVTGQVCLMSETTRTWRGLRVSKQNWDRRHPQLTIDISTENVAIHDARSFKGTSEDGLPSVVISNQFIFGV